MTTVGRQPRTAPDADVIIVGAGPAGLMLAAELRLGGAGVVVLERLDGPATESRASTLHARTMEILDRRGLLGDAGSLPNEPRGHFGGLPLDLGDVPTPFPGLWKMPQTRLEALLGARAIERGATILRGYDVIGLTDEGALVTVVARGPRGDRRFRAAHVVGCDGEQSAVRRLAGFPFPGESAGRELIRADVTGVSVPDRRFQRLPGGLAISATRDGVTRVMMHEFGVSRPPRTAVPSFAEVADTWQRITGDDLRTGRPVWINAFGDAARQVPDYRIGRVLLAGDAAHVQLPVGGQSLNLALHDAVNLGWKLAGRIRGWAADEVLESYHRERHAAGAAALTLIRAQTELLLGGPGIEPLRSIVGELLDHPRARNHLARMIAGLAGPPLPDGEVVTGDGVTTVADLLRPGKALLIDSTDEGDPAATAERWFPRVRAVRAKAAAVGEAVLLRPDGQTAWASGGTESLKIALRRWFGAPPARKTNGFDSGQGEHHGTT